jgi:NAD(P)-dependent dehydrogenase (short-subunit alcohol dehydrogenase family)
MQVYGQSKLGNIHFTYELARRLQGTGVTVNVVHPGVFRSNLGTSEPSPRWISVVTRLSTPFLNPAEVAAERVLYLATSPEVEGISGKYYGNKVELHSPPQTLDAAANRRLWDISEQLTHLAKTH